MNNETVALLSKIIDNIAEQAAVKVLQKLAVMTEPAALAAELEKTYPPAEVSLEKMIAAPVVHPLEAVRRNRYEMKPEDFRGAPKKEEVIDCRPQLVEDMAPGPLTSERFDEAIRELEQVVPEAIREPEPVILPPLEELIGHSTPAEIEEEKKLAAPAIKPSKKQALEGATEFRALPASHKKCEKCGDLKPSRWMQKLVDGTYTGWCLKCGEARQLNWGTDEFIRQCGLYYGYRETFTTATAMLQFCMNYERAKALLLDAEKRGKMQRMVNKLDQITPWKVIR